MNQNVLPDDNTWIIYKLTRSANFFTHDARASLED